MGRDTAISLARGLVTLTSHYPFCVPSSELGAVRDTGEGGMLADLGYLVSLQGTHTTWADNILQGK